MSPTSIDVFRQVCKQCGIELGLDPDEVELQSDVFDSKGLLMKPITFPKQEGADQYGLFGFSGDPAVEAIMIGVLGSAIYDLLKMGTKEAQAWISERRNFEAIVRKLGEIGQNGREVAVQVWAYLGKNLNRILHLLDECNVHNLRKK